MFSYATLAHSNVVVVEQLVEVLTVRKLLSDLVEVLYTEFT